MPSKLSALMDSGNAAAAVRAGLALEQLNNDSSRAQPSRRIRTGGIKSLARPDGNATGVSILAADLDGKRQ